MLPSHWFLPEMLMNRENPVIWLDKRHTWPHSTKEILSDTTCLDEHPLAKDLRHSIIPSRDSDDHRILKSDWTRGTTAHIQLKLALPNVAFSHYFHIKNLRYWFFLGIWPGNPANWTYLATHNQKNTLRYYLSWWECPCKICEISIDSFRRDWWSKNPALWFDEKHTWSHPNEKASLRCYHPLMTIFM